MPATKAASSVQHGKMLWTAIASVEASTEKKKKKKSAPNALLSHAALTLWLFTESDFPTFVLPNTVFGLCAALSPTSTLSGPSAPTITAVLSRLPAVVLFNWSNLLVFDLNNQRSPLAVAEDRANKPWRPIPAGRISCAQTTRLLLAALPAVFAANAALGVGYETALLFVLTWAYNDLAAGDGLLRNPTIAVAFGLYNLGSLRVAAAQSASVAPRGAAWIVVVSAIILTTMHVQDLKDTVGDAARGRLTPPLYFGQHAARAIIAVAVLFWPGVCWALWRAPLWSLAVQLALGACIAVRVCRWRDQPSDCATWRLWCLWTALLYTCPCLSS